MKSHKVEVTGRDTEVLVSVYKHRYLSVSQIRALHFPSLQTAYRRLRALTGQRCLESFWAPHIPERIFYLTAAGAEKVAATLGVASTDLKWKEVSHKPKDYYFLRHFLQINDFRILLGQACQGQNIELLGFIPEYYGRRTDAGGMAKYIRDVVCDIRAPEVGISHTPDAVFALRKEAQAALFLLEIDRGTEIVSSEEKGVLKAIKFYTNYLLADNFQRYQQDFCCGPFKGFRALFVTTSQVRVDNIRKAADSLSIDSRAKRFVWLAALDKLSSHGPFAPIWQSADSQDAAEYKIG